MQEGSRSENPTKIELSSIDDPPPLRSPTTKCQLPGMTWGRKWERHLLYGRKELQQWCLPTAWSFSDIQNPEGVQGSPVLPSTLLDVSGAVPQEVVLKLLEACKTSSFDNIQEAAAESIADGWPVRHLTFDERCINPPGVLLCTSTFILP